MGRPELIMCGRSFYEAYRRELGWTIWQAEFDKAKRQLARLGV